MTTKQVVSGAEERIREIKPIDDVFLTSRVLDVAAYDELAQELSQTIAQARRQAEDLTRITKISEKERRRLLDAAGAVTNKADLAQRLAGVLDERLLRADRLAQQIQTAEQVVQRTGAAVNELADQYVQMQEKFAELEKAFHERLTAQRDWYETVINNEHCESERLLRSLRREMRDNLDLVRGEMNTRFEELAEKQVDFYRTIAQQLQRLRREVRRESVPENDSISG